MPRGNDSAQAFSFNWPIDEYTEEVAARAQIGFMKAAAFVQGEIKDVISQKQVPKKSTRAYARERGTTLDPNKFRRSKPGEPPAIETGQLRNSIQVAPRPGGSGARVGSIVKHGFWLEMGTAKVLPRPFIAPTMAKNQRNIEAIIRREIAGGDQSV